MCVLVSCGLSTADQLAGGTGQAEQQDCAHDSACAWKPPGRLWGVCTLRGGA